MPPIDTNGPYDLAETLWLLSMGPADPTQRVDAPGRIRLAWQTPDGPVAFALHHAGDQVQVDWLDGQAVAEESGLAEQMPDFLGVAYQPPALNRSGAPRRLAHLARKHAGMRVPRLPVVSLRLVQIILQQLVSFRDATAAWRQIVHRHGERVANQEGLWYPPTPATLARLASHQWAECGVLPRFGRTVVEAMKHTARIEATWLMGKGQRGQGQSGDEANAADELGDLLAKLPGIGPWTLGFLRGAGLGDADALVPGDYSHPQHVARFFRGEARSSSAAADKATDADMLELLEPFKPHRFYVLALLLKGFPPAPRKGPRRRSVRDRLG